MPGTTAHGTELLEVDMGYNGSIILIIAVAQHFTDHLSCDYTVYSTIIVDCLNNNLTLSGQWYSLFIT